MNSIDPTNSSNSGNGRAPSRRRPTPPGEGERRAQRGYTRQYSAAAAAIYAGLDRGDLRWVGLADRCAGIADDVVLGYDNHVIGHQFKTSREPGVFRIGTLLTGADGLLPGLVQGWSQLVASCPGQTVTIRVVVTDLPSTNDVIGNENGASIEFIADWQANPARSLAEWRETRWREFIEGLLSASGLDEPEFDEFFRHLELIHGGQPNFVQRYAINAQSQPLVERIAHVLPTLVARVPEQDRWTRAEFLQELDWPDIAPRHRHRFPLGHAVQRNPTTEAALRLALNAAQSGYVSLIGPPGTGKSTLLQIALETEPSLFVVRYLAFVPGMAQGVGRAEADDFLADVIAGLRNSGLSGVRFRCESTHERQEEFETLLQAAGARYHEHGVKTLIVVDGLDHVPREEHPQRSFLSELPLPAAVPDGVIFLLGTQRVDLPGVPGAVVDQASANGRRVEMDPLPLPAIAAMADRMGLPANVPRNRLSELGQGHPLATHYLIEALLAADDAGREALLSGAFEYSGDIEAVYRSAWRGIADDSDAADVLGLIARAEAPLPPTLLAQIVREASVERAWAKTQHLLARGPAGWSIFHNSFRLFIRRQQRLRFGEVDPDYSKGLYRKLVDLARHAPQGSPQRDLELRYLMRAEEHREALTMATPAFFRAQFLAGRSASDIQDDIRLAFHSLEAVTDPTAAFALILASDEIARRVSALEESSETVDALIALGQLDAAERFVDDLGGDGYRVVDAWLDAGDFERARSLFERIEPLHDLGTESRAGRGPLSRDKDLVQWAEHAVYFRTPADIVAGIQRIVETARRDEHDWEDADHLSRTLRQAAAIASLEAEPIRDPDALIIEYGLDADDWGWLTLSAANLLLSDDEMERGQAAIGRVLDDPAQMALVHRSVLRGAALSAAHCGLLPIAASLVESSDAPAISQLDDELQYESASLITRAVMEHAELISLVGATPPAVARSRKLVLRPLQQFADTAGRLAARTRQAPETVARGEVAHECSAFLRYVARANPGMAGEHFAVSQLHTAASVVVQSLLASAARLGQEELERVVSEVDRILEEGSIEKHQFTPIVIMVAEALARDMGRVDEAERRLDVLLNFLDGDTPGQYLSSTARLIRAYANIGRPERGRALLEQQRDETLGYALRAKKDPQYVLWRMLLQEANRAEPGQRPRRVEALTRQATGMAQTEGRDAAYRIAHDLVVEAASDSAGLGWAVADQLLEAGLIDVADLVDALMIGTLRRAPERVNACVDVWISLCLPFYREAYYRESHEGDFIREAIAVSASTNVETIAETLAENIEVHAQIDVRPRLIQVLAQAVTARGVRSSRAEASVARLASEIALPRQGGDTPRRYDDVTSMEDLVTRLAQDSQSEPANYEASHAFSRLLPTSAFETALAVFDRNPGIQGDNRARFDLVDRAVALGRMDEARRLTDAYSVESDRSATWAWYMGGGRLRYFQTRLRLEGAAVRREAYADFATSLAAGRESLFALLPEVDDIWPVLTPDPAWPDMWAWVEEQLAATRDHRLGSPLAMVEILDDADVVSRLLERLITLPVNELQWQAGRGAISTSQSDPAAFLRLIQRLLAGSDDETLIGLRLLRSVNSMSVREELSERVQVLANHDDLAVRYLSRELGQVWGIEIDRREEPLPLFYRLALPGSELPVRDESLRHSRFGAPVVSDAAAWSAPFEAVIARLARSGASEEHIRQRVQYFIDRWGGVEAFGREAGQRLTKTLELFGLRLAYFHPHILAAVGALRHVAGELERAGLLDPSEIPKLIAALGAPPSWMKIDVLARPDFVKQPLPPRAIARSDADWFSKVSEDVQNLDSGEDTVIAEVTRYQSRSSSTTHEWTRTRFLRSRFPADTDPIQAYYALPEARLIDRIVEPVGAGRALVRRVVRSRLPQIPEFEFTLDEQLVQRLGWVSADEQRSFWVDGTGQPVARAFSWRDAGPDGRTHYDCLWGDGAAVTVTPRGRAQLEALVGPIEPGVCARRMEGRGDDVIGESFAVAPEPSDQT